MVGDTIIFRQMGALVESVVIPECQTGENQHKAFPDSETCSLWCRDKGEILQWILESGKQLAQAAHAHKAGGRLMYKFRRADRALFPGVHGHSSTYVLIKAVHSRALLSGREEAAKLSHAHCWPLMTKSISSLIWLPGSFALLPHLPHLLSGDRDGDHGGL